MSAAFRLRRFWRLTQQALGEALRLRSGWVLIAVVFAVTLGSLGLGELNFGGDEGRFIVSLAFGALHVAGTFLAVVLPVALVSAGLDGGTLALVLVRGVTRAEWLLARLLAVVIVVTWLALLVGLLLVVLLHLRGLEPEVTALMRAGALAGARLAVVAGLALLAAVLARQAWAALALAGGLVLAAQLADVAAWMFARSGDGLAVVGRVLVAGVPHLAKLGPETTAPGLALAYAAGWTALLALAAAVIFSRREL